MFKVTASVKKTLDKLPDVQKALSNLGSKEVFVGIPEGDIGNHDDVTNAQLMYLMTHGVRSKEMREEMNDYMGMTPGGMPIMRDFNLFSSNMQKMSYPAAYELFIHEHGSPLWHTPPRPVLEPAISTNKDKIAPYLKLAAQAALDGGDPSMSLQRAGQYAVNIVKDWFYNPENRWPPNAESTKKLKGSDRPLVDTGNLRNSITFIIADKTNQTNP